MRRLLLALTASILLAGCGGSSDEERAAGTPAPTAAATETAPPAATSDPAADEQIARASTLKAEDFPAGWTSEPDDQGDTDSGCEDWEAAKRETSARYDADEFSKGDTTQVINTVYVYADEAAATGAFARMGTDETRTCFGEELAKQLAAETDIQLGDVTDEPIEVEGVGDENAAGRLILPLKVEEATVELAIDLIFARTGRGVQLLAFLNIQDPFDADLREQLTAAGVDRLTQNLQ